MPMGQSPLLALLALTKALLRNMDALKAVGSGVDP
jgi:hypothetical protein